MTFRRPRMFTIDKAFVMAFVDCLNYRWCCRIGCTTCDACELKNAIYMLFHNGDQAKKYTNGKLNLFPNALARKIDEGLSDEIICHVCEQMIENLAENSRLDLQILQRTDAFRVASMSEKMGIDLASESNQADLRSMFNCQNSSIKHALGALERKSNRAARSLDRSRYDEEFGHQTVLETQDFPGLMGNLRDAKWLVLSYIELAAECHLSGDDQSFIKGKLRSFAEDNQELGWIYNFAEKKLIERTKPLSALKINEANRVANIQTKHEKNEWLKKFVAAGDVQRLRMIAQEEFPYRIEFVPSHLVPIPSRQLDASLAFLSLDERNRLIAWIGDKSGRWNSIKKLLQRPFLASRTSRSKIKPAQNSGKPKLSLVKNRDKNLFH